MSKNIFVNILVFIVYSPWAHSLYPNISLSFQFHAPLSYSLPSITNIKGLDPGLEQIIKLLHGPVGWVRQDGGLNLTDNSEQGGQKQFKGAFGSRINRLVNSSICGHESLNTEI